MTPLKRKAITDTCKETKKQTKHHVQRKDSDTSKRTDSVTIRRPSAAAWETVFYGRCSLMVGQELSTRRMAVDREATR